LPKLPAVFIEAAEINGSEAKTAARAVNPSLTPAQRVKNFREVETAMPENSARSEGRRCLRCDLAFTEEKYVDIPLKAVMEGARHD
jgi:hypothetical protein